MKLILAGLLGLIFILPAYAADLVRYTKLSDCARKNGTLRSYDGEAAVKGVLKAGGCRVEYSVPENPLAYDMVPIRYTISVPAGSRRVMLESTAFEDAERAKNKPLYDLACPGDLSVKLEYLGSMSAHFDESKYKWLQPDPDKCEPVTEMPLVKAPLVRSGTVKADREIWFRFRLTNTGNTILDPEGFGSAQFLPSLMKFNPDGSRAWDSAAQPVNLFERHLGYIYPGEKYEFWVQFAPKLDPGRYEISLNYGYRNHKTYDYWTNVWAAMTFAQLTVPLTIAEEAADTPVKTSFRITDTSEKMPGYLERFEEFMTSFDYFEPSEKGFKKTGVMYLQPAPWTKHIALKLILSDPKAMSAAYIPVNTRTDHLKIAYNPDNEMTLVEDGVEKPVFVAQAMPGMRANYQLGPDAQERMLAEAKEMKALGVNVISNTAGGWWRNDFSHRLNVSGMAYRYWYEYCVREAGLKALGCSVYPGNNSGSYQTSNFYRGADKKGTGEHVDPGLPDAIADLVEYTYRLWGDTWYTTRDGRMPIEMEDSWGWMRYDVNQRYKLSDNVNALFAGWLKARYGTIAAVNKAWGSWYKSFDEIDVSPIDSVMRDNSRNERYRPSSIIMREWTEASEDFDRFRTERRMQFLSDVEKATRRFLPNACSSLRTEGATLIAKGDPASEDSDQRHVFYNQKRQALIYDIVKETGALKFFDDYTTIAYDPEYFRQSLKEAREAGVTTFYLMQFDHMRDILLNRYYGRDYTIHYGLDKNAPEKLGMMIHALAAAYPYWRIAYEEGHAPGILWADYLCDGFATETQKKEIKVLTENFPKREIR